MKRYAIVPRSVSLDDAELTKAATGFSPERIKSFHQLLGLPLSVIPGKTIHGRRYALNLNDWERWLVTHRVVREERQ